jgi:hypothetical protein
MTAVPLEQIPPRRRCEVCAKEGTMRCAGWLPCERCTTAGSPSELDHRLCSTCLPARRDAQTLSAVAAQRVRLSTPPSPWKALPDLLVEERRAVAPDDDHVWLRTSREGRPHLFEAGEMDSYCSNVRLVAPVRLNVVTPVSSTEKACRVCWRSFHAGRRSAS